MKAISFKNSYLELGPSFYQSIEPVPVRDPELIIRNDKLARELGLTETLLCADEGDAVFAGNALPEGAAPIAMAYSGHQFGHFNNGLGDGRAILLGQVEHPDGGLFDIHMKGTGRTAFSRSGDGRAALGPVLREYLVSEAMARLDVPTTRALAAVTTGEEVLRDRHLPGGIITRVATSFIRVGTFQYFLARGDLAGMTRLADYVIAHYYPEVRGAENPYLALLDSVIEGQARLIAKWMQLGFIHGVMNTDNMSILCETIDYGPCAFMDHYAHERVYSSIDHHGRYAYNNQPDIGLWNLSRLAECLLPLFDQDTDIAVELAGKRLERFADLYRQHWLSGMRTKLGLKTEDPQDEALITALFALMDEHEADFTLTFYHLSQLDNAADDSAVATLFDGAAAFLRWLDMWRARSGTEAVGDAERKAMMQSVNPVYIPRNHQVEAAIRAAEDHGDFSVFRALHEVLQNPYEFRADKRVYMQPPQPHEVVQKTFCGT